ncbi:hypothetical protein N7G274_002915 [Stereocaulon virgatum]|uniref:Uncharacterized protein n=1 Tax=Stereocaulon virgatum TaxID=373712 RepID=A0ABR4AEK0_9LECA
MKDHQILRFVSPKRNDWYRRRSWLPDEPSPLALYDVTPDTVNTWSDDSDDYDWSDIRYDGMSDDSITASHGSSPKTSDFSDEDVTYEETATRRKESDPRRKECSSAPEPNNRKAVHHASNDKTKPSEPKDSASTSSEKTACNSAKATTCHQGPMVQFTTITDVDRRNGTRNPEAESKKQRNLPKAEDRHHPPSHPSKIIIQEQQKHQKPTRHKHSHHPKGKPPPPTQEPNDPDLPPSKR